MITEPSLARHGVLPPDGQRFANLLLHLLAGMLLLPLVLIASLVIFFAYWNFMPAYSASTIVPDLQARVSLRFYYTSGQESGRSVIIETPRGSTTIEMCGFDWAHWGRTRNTGGGVEAFPQRRPDRRQIALSKRPESWLRRHARACAGRP